MAILSTRDYEIFKIHECNREVKESSVKRLIQSIKEKNLLDSCPILVNGEMYVIDGQHRLKAAEELGIPIYYRVQSDIEIRDMVKFNSNNVNWSLDDYFNFYSRHGFESCIRAKETCKKYGLTFGNMIRLRGIRSVKNPSGLVKNGKWDMYNEKIQRQIHENLDKVQIIKDIIVKESLDPVAFGEYSKFVNSLFEFISKEYIDFDLFLEKVKLRVNHIRNWVTAEEYCKMWKNIYNYRNQNPIE